MSVRITYLTSLSESSMESGISDAIRARGGVAFHIRDSRGMNVVGLPDLICIDPMGSIVRFVEVKSQRRNVTPEQRHVLALLGGCERVQSGIVRPRPKDARECSYDDLIDELRGETA